MFFVTFWGVYVQYHRFLKIPRLLVLHLDDPESDKKPSFG